jgi:WD domain, G-beta repeat
MVLGVRADFYGPCLAYPALLTALQSPVALGPMSAEQLRAVTTRPAQAECLDLEPGLVELLLRDLGVAEDAGADAAGYDPGALPLLAHALRATWQQREGQTLTVAGYRRTGGISQALATTAERAYTRLSPAEQQIVRQILLRLVNVSDQGGSGDTRRRLPRARLVEVLPLPGSTDAVEEVLEVFGRARLLTFDTASVEITHEALLRAAVVALHLSGTAQRERDTALFNQITAQADRLRGIDTSLAAQLDLTAYRMRPTPGLYTTLLTLGNAALSTVLVGHPDDVNAVVFSPDGHALATGCSDHTIRLWNVADPTHPAPLDQPLTGHTNHVKSVAFSPDGHTLASGSTDHTVRLWRVDLAQVIQRICAITTNTLTPATWERYVSPDLPYHPPCP